jgi:hypothetical protein
MGNLCEDPSVYCITCSNIKSHYKLDLKTDATGV